MSAATNGTLATAATEQSMKPASPSTSLLARLGERFGVDADKMLGTLKATAFRQKGKDGTLKEVTNEQMMALLIVADQYHLNPWTKEIYAFPQDGGIVPIVGVDGWVRIINERPEFDGLDFNYGPEFELKNDRGEVTGYAQEWVECTIRRKDRQYPIVVREYFRECVRATIPWKDMPRRMLRHKVLIQAARIAFGFAGIYDEDEGDRIIDATTRAEPVKLPPQGRVHHNRVVNALPATPEPAPTVDEGEAEEKAIKREELITWLNDQLDNDVPVSVLDEVAGKLRDSQQLLGPDIMADMQRRYQAKRGQFDAAFAKVKAPATGRRNF